MQAQVSTLEAQAADAEVLTAFVSHVVGVDVVACQRTASDGAGGDGAAAASLDPKELRERFEIVDALKTKALRQEIERLQAAGNSGTPQVENLLPMSPAALPSANAAAGAPQVSGNYEEIDLLSDPLPAPVAPALVDRQQLDQAMQQVQRLEENMKQSALENEELRRKFDDLWQQQRSQLDEIVAERDALRSQLGRVGGQEQ
ncbi:hypothetical protein PINS_up017785 [Pythium insidiosum]|nr:hypothetical protein PINS_up017785 [Pythium insidiosum]